MKTVLLIVGAIVALIVWAAWAVARDADRPESLDEP